MRLGQVKHTAANQIKNFNGNGFPDRAVNNCNSALNGFAKAGFDLMVRESDYAANARASAKTLRVRPEVHCLKSIQSEIFPRGAEVGRTHPIRFPVEHPRAH